MELNVDLSFALEDYSQFLKSFLVFFTIALTSFSQILHNTSYVIPSHSCQNKSKETTSRS